MKGAPILGQNSKEIIIYSIYLNVIKVQKQILNDALLITHHKYKKLLWGGGNQIAQKSGGVHRFGHKKRKIIHCTCTSVMISEQLLGYKPFVGSCEVHDSYFPDHPGWQ